MNVCRYIKCHKVTNNTFLPCFDLLLRTSYILFKVQQVIHPTSHNSESHSIAVTEWQQRCVQEAARDE